MIVIDASAAVEALLGGERRELAALLAAEHDLHAPHLIDVEVASAARGLARSGAVSPERAGDLLGDWSELAVIRYPHEGLLEGIWELRDRLSAYDASYLTLASILEARLCTLDGGLLEAAGALGVPTIDA